MKKTTGFTLIELLIVVLIIAILAAIAVPNFLEFQTRAKVSRVKADFRNLSVAIEAYNVDNDFYPLDHGDLSVMGSPLVNSSWPFSADYLLQVTTPIAYMTTVPSDVFEWIGSPTSPGLDAYFSPLKGRGVFLYTREDFRGINGNNLTPLTEFPAFAQDNVVWLLISVGPNGFYEDAVFFGPGGPHAGTSRFDGLYDPTNGTISFGDILRSNSKQH